MRALLVAGTGLSSRASWAEVQSRGARCACLPMRIGILPAGLEKRGCFAQGPNSLTKQPFVLQGVHIVILGGASACADCFCGCAEVLVAEP